VFLQRGLKEILRVLLAFAGPQWFAQSYQDAIGALPTHQAEI
jgi:hypothetical protein